MMVVTTRHSSVASLLAITIFVTESIAVTCQFVQGTDPRFPLSYFTVDSALLLGLGAGLSLVAPLWRHLPELRHTAAVGSLTSAVIFAAVIAPASTTGNWIQSHDDIPVRIATILMHGVAPVLVVIEAISQPGNRRFADQLRWAYSWPVIYLVLLLMSARACGGGIIPYPFLRPSLMGWHIVFSAVVAVGVLVGVLSGCIAGLGVVGERLGRHRRSYPVDPPSANA